MRVAILRSAICVAVSALGVAALPARAAESAQQATSVGASAAERAADLVTQALSAEAAGDLEARNLQLARALSVAPDYAPAHWHLGHVRDGSEWKPADAVSAGSDRLLADYHVLREELGNTADAHYALARWCRKNNLPDEAQAHAVRFFELKPDHPEALKLVGLVRYQGMLLTPSEVAQREANVGKARAAMAKWKPQITEWRFKIDTGTSEERAEAAAALAELKDPAAIGALEVVLGGREHAWRLIESLGRIPGPAATEALLRRALLAPDDELRKAACQELQKRPPHAFVPRLLASLSTPWQVDVSETTGEGEFRVTARRESATKVREITLQTSVIPNANPNLASIIGEVRATVASRAADLEKSVKSANQKLARANEPVYRVLETATGADVPRDAAAWWDWWRGYNEMTPDTKAVQATRYTESVDVPYVPYSTPQIPVYTAVPPAPGSSAASSSSPGNSSRPASGPGPVAIPVMYTAPMHNYCFGRGTLVQTLTGPLAIELVQVGDRVLAQDPITGELAHKAVLGTTYGAVTQGITIKLPGEEIVATRGHVFWVSGKGWRMARDLEPGDRMHTIAGWTEVEGVSDTELPETFNLVVADSHTYFVGTNRVLSHDVTMLQPTTAKVPGQREE